MTPLESKRAATFGIGGIASVVLLLASFAILYHPVAVKLVHDWAFDDNYSHGFLILPLALYFAWERRGRLIKAPLRPNGCGLFMVLGSFAVLIAGTLGCELFLARISIPLTVSGVVVFLWGWAHLKILIFPILFLLLMIPIPAIIFNSIAFPLQLIASHFGEYALSVFRVPVLREGNIIHLANTSLEVAEACSGIRSLISLLTLGIVYGYFVDSRIWIRTFLALASIPISILANGTRVALTGVAAHRYGPEVAQGFFHSFSGWLIFLIAFILLFIVHRVIRWLCPARAGGASHALMQRGN